MRWTVRALALLLLPASVSCAVQSASTLRQEGVRAALSARLLTTLEEQEHYFARSGSRQDFARRLDGIVRATTDAESYYQALADALASLGEGHTGLVGSAEVRFSSTIPPVALLDVEDRAVVAGTAPGIEGGGLRPGDVVLEVDGHPAARVLEDQLRTSPGSTLHARRARAYANLLAGPTNSPAVVRVRGTDGRERSCFPLRFLLDDQGLDRFRFGFLPRMGHGVRLTREVAYLALPEFHPDAMREFERLLGSFAGMPHLVLDLRGNPGGRIRTLQRVAGLFFQDAVDFVSLRDGERVRTLRTLPGRSCFAGRVTVLVDERTGSAAELLAAALQDLGRGQVIGRPTAGSARARLSAVLPGGVLFHYAGRSEFLRRDGRPIEGVGVIPDVFYRPTRADLARGSYGDPFRDPAVRLALGRN